MNKPHITIERYKSTSGEFLYHVFQVNGSKTNLLTSSPHKNGAYQSAHRFARSQNAPLYEVLYKTVMDENGVSHLIPEKNIQVKIENFATEM
jgi:hypothetical protein